MFDLDRPKAALDQNSVTVRIPNQHSLAPSLVETVLRSHLAHQCNLVWSTRRVHLATVVPLTFHHSDHKMIETHFCCGQ